MEDFKANFRITYQSSTDDANIEEYSFFIDGIICNCASELRFARVESNTFRHNDSVSINSSFELPGDACIALPRYLDKIRARDFEDISSFSRDGFNPQTYNNVTVSLDGVDYDLRGSSDVLLKLEGILRIADFRKALSVAKEKTCDIFGGLDILED